MPFRTQREKPITLEKGYSTFQYRPMKNKPGYWEERRNGGSWTPIRTTNDEAEVERAINKLESQGYVRK